MRERRTGELVSSAVFNTIVLVAVNLWRLWQPLTMGVVLPSWAFILWAANLSLAVQIVGNIILAGYRPKWFNALMQTVFAAFSLLSLVVFLLVFPLDFSRVGIPWLNLALHVVLIVGIVGAVIGVVVNLVRFIVGVVRIGTDEAESR
jgi:hypothetical protein